MLGVSSLKLFLRNKVRTKTRESSAICTSVVMSWSPSGLCTRSVLEVDEVPDDKRDFVSKSVKSMCGSAVPEPFVVTARAIVLR